jgi:hypothetical protein
MNRTARLIAGIAIGLVIAAGVYAKEKKIKQSDLPAAVQQTAEQQSAGEGIQVTGYTVNKADDGTLYTMDLVADGLARKTVIAADGTLVSVQQEMTWDNVPATVQADFTNVTGKGKLGPVSSITKDGKIVTYEAMLHRDGRANHVQVKPHAPALEAIPTSSPN